MERDVLVSVRRSLHPSRRVWRLVLLATLLGLVFVVDTLTPREIAVAVFYVAVILVGIELLSPRGVVALACVCVALTVLSLVLTSNGSREAGLANAVISVSAIAITTYLGLRLVAAIAAVHESHAQFTRVARLSSLGELTASIAHEVNQPLAAIVTSGQAASRWLDVNPPNVERARLSVDRVINDANRASDIVRRVRRLASGGPSQKQRISINTLILEAVNLAQGELERQAITLHLNLDQDAAIVDVDPVQIQQVIANLLLNAIDALQEVDTNRRELLVSSCSYAHNVVVSVADTGIGLSPDAQEHLFDTFWSTKENGVGIGLAISRTIVEAHGGRIWMTPQPDGAMLQFSLPGDQKEDA
jgi:signal transduction histidine kinase